MGILHFLVSLLPTMVIRGRKDIKPYLIRRTIFWSPWLRIYVHEILRSDDDPYMHCHPWAFWSLILKGGYKEYLPGKSTTHEPGEAKERDPGTLIRHKATDLHKIELRKDKDSNEVPAWTLVACGKKIREWGFLTSNGWVPQDVYFSKHGEGDTEHAM